MRGSVDEYTEIDMSEEIQPSGIELAPRVRVSEDDLHFKFVRSSGPGGQNVNKVSTACELRIDFNIIARHLTFGASQRFETALGSRLTSAGEIILTSDEKRSQEQNRAKVLERLRDMLIRAMIEPKKRKKTKPSRASKQRRLDSKKRRSEIKSGRRSVE